MLAYPPEVAVTSYLAFANVVLVPDMYGAEPEKVEPSLINKYFNRLYFAIITGCLLGYGDIYPVSKLSKLICGVQGLFTVALIIY